MPKSWIFLPVIAAFAAGCANERENVVHVIAEQAPGLKKSARVQYRGIEVGWVKQVYFTPGGVRIDLHIDRKDVPIRSRDTVRITSVGAFGEQVVDIHPGPQTAPLLAHDATLPKVQAESTVSLPVGVWRNVVASLGLYPDTSLHDTVIVLPRARDSTRMKRAPQKAP